MILARPLSGPTPTRHGAARLAVLVGLLTTALLLPLSGAQAQTSVGLGTAESFAVLAGTTITNTGSTVVTGDIGLHPEDAVTGFGPGADSVTQDGSLHLADGVALQAKNDLVTAYDDAAGQTPVTTVPTELGSTTLKAGVYDSTSTTFGITGELTLDAEDDPDAVFIFTMGSTLTAASDSSVNLLNGADPCNVFWQVGSSATLGTDADFTGTIMALESITLNTGATVEGRVLARNGAVTMDTNTITNTVCATPVDDGDDTPVDDGDDTPVDDGDDTPVDDDGDDTPVEGDVPSDGTPTDGDTSDGDTSEGASTDGGTSGGASSDGDASEGTPTGQVTGVPSGGVAAGGGTATTAGGMPWLLAGTLLAVAAAGTVGVAARRRIRA